jgi:hypothetical protein
MALLPRVESIPLALGIDTKTSPVLVGQQSLTLIQNAKFTKGAKGEMVPRNGYTAMAGTIAAGQALAQLNGELDVIDSGLLKAYSPSQSAWVSRGTVSTPIPSLTPIVSNNFTQSVPDAATLNNVTVYAWQDSRAANSIWFKVVDQSSGTVLQDETQLVTGWSQPRVIAIANTGLLGILASSVAGTTIQIWTIDSVNPTNAPGGPTVLASSLATSAPFEAVYVPGATPYICIACLNGSNYAEAHTITASTLVPLTAVVLRNVAMANVTCILGAAAALVVASQVPGPGVVATYVDFLLPSSLATLHTYNHNVASYTGMALALASSSPITINLYGNVAATALVPCAVGSSQWVYGTGFIGVGNAIDSVQMVGYPVISFATGAIYLLTAFQSTVQPTYFLFNAPASMAGTAQLVSRNMPSNAGQAPAVQRFSHYMNSASGLGFYLSVPQQRSLVSAAGKPVTILGLSVLTFDFSQTQVKTLQLGQDLSIAGGLPQLYDSEVITEDGFNVLPDSVTVTLLTSQIGITAIVDGTASATQTFTITVPINQDGSGNDGKLINANDYIAVFQEGSLAGGSSTLIWFNIDGAGTAPTGPGAGFGSIRQVNISAFSSAASIATQIAAQLTIAIGGTFRATATGNQIACTQGANGITVRPYTRSQFEIVSTATGTNAVHGARCLNCLPGSLIHPGQWFSFISYTAGNVPQNTYVWFTLNGVGADPTPAPNMVGYVVNILASDTETGVAAKIAAQLTGGTVTAAVLSSTNVVMITDVNFAGAAYSGGVYPLSTGTIGSGLGTIGSVAANQWDSYVFTGYYEHIDANGQLARSGVAAPVSIMMPTYGLGNHQVNVAITNLQLTTRQSVDIVIERTQANGLIFFRATSQTALLYNAIGGLTATTWQDFLPDASLLSQEEMYTQPLQTISPLPNITPRSWSQAAIFQDQRWTNSCEDPYTWWSSKDFQNGVQIEQANQSLRFDPTGGVTVAAMAMDSNLVVFAQTRIWAVSGLGPDSTGQGQGFTVTLVSSAIGCRDASSLALLPDGILFKSSKGWHLLGRDLQTRYVGLGVEAYNSDVCVSAQVIPNTTEVRCLCASGTTLLYDYQYSQWGTFTNHLGVDSIVYGGAYYYLPATGTPFLEAVGTYGDNGTGFGYLLTTAWLKPGALQGFGRIWDVYFQGFLPGTNPIQVTIAYDYNPTIVDTFTLNPTAGSGNVLPDQIQIRVRPSRQKCEAMQFTIQDTAPFWQFTKKIALNMLDLEMGVKKGGFKRLGPPGNI